MINVSPLDVQREVCLPPTAVYSHLLHCHCPTSNKKKQYTIGDPHQQRQLKNIYKLKRTFFFLAPHRPIPVLQIDWAHARCLTFQSNAWALTLHIETKLGLTKDHTSQKLLFAQQSTK